MAGFNGTLFCYGQTGSGKTFSESMVCILAFVGWTEADTGDDLRGSSDDGEPFESRSSSSR